MRTRSFVATAVLAALVAAAPLASAQDRQRRPSRGDGGGGSSQSGGGSSRQGSGGSSQGGGERSQGQRSAQPRDGGGGRAQQPAGESGRTEQRADNGRREVTPPPQTRREPPQAFVQRGNTSRQGEVRPEGRAGARSDSRYSSSGRYAVPRTGPVPYYRDGDQRVYVKPGQNYYVYRYPAYRYAYPYRYGYPYRYYGYPYPYYGYSYYDPAFTGSFYWSSHAWQSGAYYSGGNFDSDLGKLRLDMQPREAEVYIDGYYAGVVDDFDGQLQGLRLEAGNYRVQVSLPGFQPLDIDVHVQPGRTTTYRGELTPERP